MTTEIIDYYSYPSMKKFLESDEVEEIQRQINNLNHQQALINEYLKIKYNGEFPYPKNQDTDYFTELRSKYTKDCNKLYCKLYKREKEIKLQILKEEMEMFSIEFNHQS